MKVFSGYLVAVLSATTVWGTEQIADCIIFEGKKSELITSWEYPSPLEIYCRAKGIGCSFGSDVDSTGNYRGHVATWELRDTVLYLKGVTIERRKNRPTEVKSAGEIAAAFETVEEVVPLSKVFPSMKVDAEKGVPAVWFTGMALVRTLGGLSWERRYEENAKEAYVFCSFEHGLSKKKTVLTRNEYFDAVKEFFDRRGTADPVKEGPIFEYSRYINSFERDEVDGEQVDATKDKVKPEGRQSAESEVEGRGR